MPKKDFVRTGCRDYSYHGDWIPYSATAKAITRSEAPLYHVTVFHHHKKKETEKNEKGCSKEAVTTGRKKRKNDNKETERWESIQIPSAMPGMGYKCSICGKEEGPTKLNVVRECYRACKFRDNVMHSHCQRMYEMAIYRYYENESVGNGGLNREERLKLPECPKYWVKKDLKHSIYYWENDKNEFYKYVACPCGVTSAHLGILEKHMSKCSYIDLLTKQMTKAGMVPKKNESESDQDDDGNMLDSPAEGNKRERPKRLCTMKVPSAVEDEGKRNEVDGATADEDDDSPEGKVMNGRRYSEFLDTHIKEDGKKTKIGEDEFNDLHGDGSVVYRLPQIFSPEEHHEARENMVKIACVLRENLNYIRKDLWQKVLHLPEQERGVVNIQGGRLVINVGGTQRLTSHGRHKGSVKARKKLKEGMKGHSTKFWKLIVDEYFGGIDPMNVILGWATEISSWKDPDGRKRKFVVSDTFELIITNCSTPQENHVDLLSPAANCMVSFTPFVDSTRTIKLLDNAPTIESMTNLGDALETLYHFELSDELKTAFADFDNEEDQVGEHSAKQLVKKFGYMFCLAKKSKGNKKAVHTEKYVSMLPTGFFMRIDGDVVHAGMGVVKERIGETDVIDGFRCMLFFSLSPDGSVLYDPDFQQTRLTIWATVMKAMWDRVGEEERYQLIEATSKIMWSNSEIHYKKGIPGLIDVISKWLSILFNQVQSKKKHLQYTVEKAKDEKWFQDKIHKNMEELEKWAEEEETKDEFKKEKKKNRRELERNEKKQPKS